MDNYRLAVTSPTPQGNCQLSIVNCQLCYVAPTFIVGWKHPHAERQLSIIHCQLSIASFSLPVCFRGDEAEQEGEGGEGGVLLPQVGDAGALQVDRTHDFDEVAWGNGVSEDLCPTGHGGDGGEQTAHQLEDDDEGEHDEDALQEGRRTVGDAYAKPRHDEGEQDGGKVDVRDVPRRDESVDQPADEHPDRDDEQADRPERDELGEDEGEPSHGGDVHRLDGPALLLAHEIQRGQEAADEDEQHHHESGYHVVAEVERRVVAVEDAGGRSFGESRPFFRRPPCERLQERTGCVLGAEDALGGIDPVGAQVEVGRLAPAEVAEVAGGNGQHDVRVAPLDVAECLVVGVADCRHGEGCRGVHVRHQAA